MSFSTTTSSNGTSKPNSAAAGASSVATRSDPAALLADPVPRRSVSELPQATLNFAAKVFDLARKGDEQTLRVYLDAGLPANMTNEKGNTLLMLAAYNGHVSLVRLLHSRGADPDRLNDRGQSPLAGAIFKGEDEVVRALVELGANPRAGTPSAVESAKVFGQERWLDLLGAAEEERRSAPATGPSVFAG